MKWLKSQHAESMQNHQQNIVKINDVVVQPFIFIGHNRKRERLCSGLVHAAVWFLCKRWKSWSPLELCNTKHAEAIQGREVSVHELLVYIPKPSFPFLFMLSDDLESRLQQSGRKIIQQIAWNKQIPLQCPFKYYQQKYFSKNYDTTKVWAGANKR